MEQDNFKKTAMKVSVITIVINFLLSAFKLIAGIVANSGAMISDAVHSASDVFSTFIVMIGVNISEKKSDKDHQYGHERFECVAAIILAVILFLTGIGIGINGINKLRSDNNDIAIPGILALIAAVISIAVKEWMFWYTRAAAKKINSGALMADAWHHRSDAMSSVGALIGIAGAMLGFPILDVIAEIVICIFIGKAAFDIFKDAIDRMVDKSCDKETENEIKTLVEKQDGVSQIDLIKTRIFGSKIYVDIEVSVNANLTLTEAHIIAENVHSVVEKEFNSVKHCMVHVNPETDKNNDIRIANEA